MLRGGVATIRALCIILTYFLATASTHASEIELVIDNQSFANQFVPILTDRGFVVPLQLARALGAEVEEKDQMFILRYGRNEARLGLGDTAPVRLVEMNGQLYVPLNFLSDFMRLRVNWDPINRVLTLSRWMVLGAPLPPLPQREFPMILPPPEPIALPTEVDSKPPFEFSASAALFHPVGDDELDTKDVVDQFVWPALTRQTGLSLHREMVAGVERYHFKGADKISVHSALIVDPYRLVVDIHGVGSAQLEPFYIGGATVRQIRVASENDHLRLIFDLKWAVGHHVAQIDDKTVTLTFNRPLVLLDVDAQPRRGRITFDVPATTPHRFYELRDPNRIVIDLEDTTLVNGPHYLEVDKGPVARLRSAQFSPDVTRIVLDLREETSLRPRAYSGELVFEYGDPFPGQVSYRVIDEREVHLAFWASQDSDVSMFQLSHPDRIAIDVQGVKLEESFREALIDTGPVFRLRASQFDADTVRIVADLRRFVHPRLYRDEDQIVVVLEQPQLSGYRISIDAGHGGHDPGATSPRLGLIESEINLKVARRLEEMIKEAGGQVQMTRRDDTYVDLWARSDLANNFGADIFVSIHHNASRSGNSTAKGTETYAQSNNAESIRLGAEIQRSLVSTLGTEDRGLRANPGYIVLNRARMPAVLVEIAFLTHADDEELLANDWFLHRAAEGIFNGLLKFFYPTPN